MKRYLGLILLALSGCGVIHETPSQPPVLTPEASSRSCEIEQKVLIDPIKLTESKLHNAILCFETKINDAFEKLQGQYPSELTLGELKYLSQKKIVTFPFEKDEAWNLVGEALRLSHKQGEPRLSKDTAQFFIDWAKQHESVWLRLIKATNSKMSHDEQADYLKSLDQTEIIDSVYQLLGFISPRYRLSRERALVLVKSLCGLEKGNCKSNAEEEIRDKTEAVWALKSFVLEDSLNQGSPGDLTGQSLKKLIDLAYKLLSNAKSTNFWVLDDFEPDKIPANLEKEWQFLGSIIQQYFTQNQFAAIDSASLYWALKKLDPDSPLASLSQDLVRLSQRLSPETQVHEGLHPIAIVPFTAISSQLAEDFKAAAEELQKHKFKENWGVSYKISLRQALLHPLLKRVALKGSIGLGINSDQKDLKGTKRLDVSISWNDVMRRLASRQVFLTLFHAFDSNEKREIKIQSDNEDELKDILDLAYTFLRFASKETKEYNPKTKKEESIPNQLVIKPANLAKVMGLIGDEWMNDGNEDGLLNAEEFFSITQIYEDIQNGANSALWSTSANSYKKLLPGMPIPDLNNLGYIPYDQRVFARKEFIHKFPESLNFDYFTSQLWESIPEEQRNSLLHALIGKRNGNPVNVINVNNIRTVDSEKIIKMNNFISSDAALAPIALLDLIQRLMIQCDKDENDELSWSELDCAMPLILKAAHQTVASNLVDLDPGVHDAGLILTSFLQMKGMPLSVAKLIAVNGSIKKFNLKNEFPSLEKFVESNVKLDWMMLGRFLMGQDPNSDLKLWTYEAKKRFSSCDLDSNGFLSGTLELSCFSEKILNSITQGLQDLLQVSISAQSVEKILSGYDLDLLKNGLVLSALPENQIDQMLNQMGVKSSPKKILLLLEEVIRRAQPLEELPE